jgi:hypothetical protein
MTSNIRKNHGGDAECPIEPFNGLFKNVFEWRTQMPVRGLNCSQLLALGAIFIYQLVLLYQHEQSALVRKGIKALLRAA